MAKTIARNRARKILKEAGVEVPGGLKPKVLARVKSKLGTMTLTEDRGMEPSPAVKTVARFEQNVGGKEKIVEVLHTLASEDALSEKEMQFLLALEQPENARKSLARLMVETGMNPLKVMSLYTRGCIEMGKRDAAIEAHRNLPQIIKNLNGHALSEVGDTCGLCAGTGKVSGRSGARNPSETQRDCPRCKGVGRLLEVSELKKFAAEKLLEVTKLTGQSGGVQIQTNVAVKVDGAGGSVLSKVMGAADEVLYRRQPVEVVEAEVVPSSSD